MHWYGSYLHADYGQVAQLGVLLALQFPYIAPFLVA